MSVFAFAAVVGLVFTSTSVNTEEIQIRMCPKTRCTVRNVFVDPCPEALNNKPCELPQGSNATIRYHYTTNFGSTTPQTRLYSESLMVDLPLMDMDPNACLYTECPVEADVENSWNFNLFVSPDYPRGYYTVKSKLWDAGQNAKKNDECCFKLKIKIV